MARHLPHKKLGGSTIRKGIPVPRDGGDPKLGPTKRLPQSKSKEHGIKKGVGK